MSPNRNRYSETNASFTITPLFVSLDFDGCKSDFDFDYSASRGKRGEANGLRDFGFSCLNAPGDRQHARAFASTTSGSEPTRKLVKLAFRKCTPLRPPSGEPDPLPSRSPLPARTVSRWIDPHHPGITYTPFFGFNVAAPVRPGITDQAFG